VISLSDDSGNKDKFVSLTARENTEIPKELEFMDILSIYLSICTFNEFRHGSIY